MVIRMRCKHVYHYARLPEAESVKLLYPNLQAQSTEEYSVYFRIKKGEKSIEEETE